MKKLRAILIDPFTKTVTKREVIAGDIDDIYELGDYTCFATVALPNGDTLFVDDEGLFKGHAEAQDGLKRGFHLISMGIDPLVGKGVILGTNHRTGNSVDCKTEAHDLMVLWFKTDKCLI